MKTLIIDSENTETISPDDLELVKRLSNGSTATQIGQALTINKRTMEARVNKLKAKIGVKTLPELVAVFFRNKLID